MSYWAPAGHLPDGAVDVDGPAGAAVVERGHPDGVEAEQRRSAPA